MHLLREALPTFNANAEGGVFLMTSSIAVGLNGTFGNIAVLVLILTQGVAVQGSTMAYSVSKAAGMLTYHEQLRMMC